MLKGGRVRSIPAWEAARAARRREAAEDAGEEEAAGKLRAVRAKLRRLLEASELVDGGLVLERVSDGELWDEQVLLHSKVCLIRPNMFSTVGFAGFAVLLGVLSHWPHLGQKWLVKHIVTLLAEQRLRCAPASSWATTRRRCGCWRWCWGTYAAQRPTARRTRGAPATPRCSACCCAPGTAGSRSTPRPATCWPRRVLSHALPSPVDRNWLYFNSCPDEIHLEPPIWDPADKLSMQNGIAGRALAWPSVPRWQSYCNPGGPL